MTTNDKPTQTPEAPSAQLKTLSDPDLSFTDYQKLRRGETLAESQPKSAPSAPKAAEQKSSPESDTEETEAKSNDPDEAGAKDSDEESDASDDSTNAKPKKKGGFKKKIDKLNARIAKREQEAEYWKSQALKSQQGAEAEPKTKPVVDTNPTAPGKPTADKYDTLVEYVEALTDWKNDQRRKADEEKQQKAKLESEHQSRLKSYNERVKAFADKTEDFEDALENLSDVPISPAIIEAITSSEQGPEMLYELAKDPKEAMRIAHLSPIAAALALGEIKAKVVIRATEAKKPETKTITNAPKPIEPTGKGGAAVSKSITDPDIPFADYVRLRRAQQKRRNA